MDFSRDIYENRIKKGAPFLVAHRGVSTANIPCNTLAAFEIAMNQGADVIEIDITKSKDGEFFVFHPNMERVYLKCGKKIPEMTAEEVRSTPLLNQDEAVTHYRIPTLQDTFSLLKDRVYINVDKFWTDIPGITEQIRKAGVEKQVIVKTPLKEIYLAQMEEYAPDLMFCALASHKDEISAELLKRRIHYIGVEALFDKDTDEIVSNSHIRWLHKQRLLIWANAIIYDEAANIAAGHTDDISMTDDPEKGWGWMLKKEIDFIQTDWILPLRLYLEKKSMMWRD